VQSPRLPWAIVSPTAAWDEALRRRWREHRRWLLPLIAALMAVTAARRIEDGLACLLRDPRCGGDPWIFYRWVHDWFAGRPVPADSILPPAGYPILWPLLGWLPLGPAMWLWTAASLAGLAWLAAILLRESGAETRAERCFVALVPLSMYAVRATFIHGQIILHLLPPLVAGLLLLRGRPAWWRDTVAAALLLVALVKPSIAAPFILLAALDGRGGIRARAVALVAIGYAGLTLFAASFRAAGLLEVMRTWTSGSVQKAASQYGDPLVYGNLHYWLGALGMDGWNPAASLLALALLAAWVYRRRRADAWILLGVTAVVARLWTYHRSYDDMLIAIPILALFRVSKLTPPEGDDRAGLVLAMTTAGALAPVRLFFLPAPWSALFTTMEAVTWLVALAFLVRVARRSEPARGSAARPG
jgi:hypothetical protein